MQAIMLRPPAEAMRARKPAVVDRQGVVFCTYPVPSSAASVMSREARTYSLIFRVNFLCLSCQFFRHEIRDYFTTIFLTFLVNFSHAISVNKIHENREKNSPDTVTLASLVTVGAAPRTRMVMYGAKHRKKA
jgi:hypothetical protein